jgi:8-oxo-dGTP diphosphatase
VFKDDKLLVAQRSYDEGHLPGYWGVPGGKVEIDPSVDNILEKTVQDELLEEVDVIVESEMRMFHNRSFTRTDGQPVIAINFICTYRSGEPTPLDDTIAVKWATKEDLQVLKIEPNSLNQILLAFNCAS